MWFVVLEYCVNGIRHLPVQTCGARYVVSLLNRSAIHSIEYDLWYWITDVIRVHPESMSEKCHGNDIPNEKTVLMLEPFYGGSHKQLIDTLINGNIQWILVHSLWSNGRKYESRIIDITLQGCEYFRNVSA